jgi:hypothetical protein
LVGRGALAQKLIVPNDPDELIKRLTPFVRHEFDVLKLNSLSPGDEVFIKLSRRRLFPTYVTYA